MKQYLLHIFLVACVLLTTSCSGTSTAYVFSSKIILIGSTPGDSSIKSSLAINPESKIDFIRWDRPSESISFLVGDENVLFFLDREDRL